MSDSGAWQESWSKAQALIAAQQPQLAIDLIENTLQQHPNATPLRAELAQLYYLNQDYAQSITHAQAALVQGSATTALSLLLAKNYFYLQDQDNCRKQCDTCADSDELSLPQLNTLGSLYCALGVWDQAIPILTRVIAATPQEITALFNLAQAHLQQRHFAKACELLGRCELIQPKLPGLSVTYATALCALGQYEQALHYARVAVATSPNNPEAWLQQAIAQYHCLDISAAQTTLQTALTRWPEHVTLRWNLAHCQLRQGDWVTGFQTYQCRWQQASFSQEKIASEKSRWNGNALTDQTLLVHSEQGFGDTLQFIRFAIALAKQCKRLILAVQPALVSLLQSLPIACQIVAKDAPLPAFDQYISLLDIPAVYPDVLQHTIGMNAYLGASVDANLRQTLKAATAPYKVGIAWSGNPKQARNHLRSIPLELLHPLLEIPGVQWINLQLDAARQEIRCNSRIQDILPEQPDFMTTAGLITELDLVISVCTATCHLSGTLGIPTWTLLAYSPCWRWGLADTSTPWYPTMRLFRQAHAGDWTDVIDALYEALLFEANN